MTSAAVVSRGRDTPDGGWPEPLLSCYTLDRLQFVRLAYLITGNPHVAEEVVQDAFVATARSWNRVREARPYVRVAVVNGSRSWLRRRKLERGHIPDRAEPSISSPDELSDVLGRLNARQRAAVVLRYYEGLPDAEIAQVLGCRTATVRTLIHRALGALRKEIQR